ncbi:DUF2313 domain-containing protein [Lactiplantibacillus sp. WILCCON 0030]|uniref:DUF2313 domain-containing protein n=1 Tax=Lactiplantibacillus brownii TaxID=3069269 RepID=A0ABU1A828_9LACO|nr:putative phage tail protein [Lactiplantibacillus brownii]MDQ7937112.1 DUF2313 domain-containing protein [Lactiplantibacillus brownii]
MGSLSSYLPDYYDDVVEMQALMDAEQVVFDGSETEMKQLLLNQFVVQADSVGLSIFETQLGIQPEPNESLDTRRYNVLARTLPPKPITIRYLRELLRAVNIPATIDVNAIDSIVKTISQENLITASQLKRLKYLLSVCLPANLAYQIIKHAEVKTKEPINYGQAISLSVLTSVGATPTNFVNLTSSQVNYGEAARINIRTAVNAELIDFRLAATQKLTYGEARHISIATATSATLKEVI